MPNPPLMRRRQTFCLLRRHFFCENGKPSVCVADISLIKGVSLAGEIPLHKGGFYWVRGQVLEVIGKSVEEIYMVTAEKCRGKWHERGKIRENTSQIIYKMKFWKIYLVETKWVNCAWGVVRPQYIGAIQRKTQNFVLCKFNKNYWKYFLIFYKRKVQKNCRKPLILAYIYIIISPAWLQ